MRNQFDEVMIVNPAPPGADPATGESIMMNYYGYPATYADPYGLAYGPPQAFGYGYPAYGFAAPWGYADPYGYADYGQTYEADDGVDGIDDYADDYEFAADDFGDWYGADDIDGYDAYVPAGPSPYNYTVPGANPLAGYDESDLDGYTAPVEVSPTVTVSSFTPQSTSVADLPDTLKPIW